MRTLGLLGIINIRKIDILNSEIAQNGGLRDLNRQLIGL